jgi:pyruvate formate-lyase activating enzyme-like uncharacterized protein
MKKKLRLLLWEACDRSCQGCCNLDWDLKTLPVCRDFSGYDEILLTGGEPMLAPATVRAVVRNLRGRSPATIYVYTAKVDSTFDALAVLREVDGMCVTLHEQKDVEPFLRFAAFSAGMDRSLRVNVFRGVDCPVIPFGWKAKTDIEWVRNSALPVGEEFMRMARFSL